MCVSFKEKFQKVLRFVLILWYVNENFAPYQKKKKRGNKKQIFAKYLKIFSLDFLLNKEKKDEEVERSFAQIGAKNCQHFYRLSFFGEIKSWLIILKLT